MTSIVATDKAPAAVGPYSQAVKANGFLYTAGQIPLRPDGSLVAGSIAEQTEQVMTNLEAVLVAAGCGFEHVVKSTCFLRDMNDFAEFNGVYGSRFGSQPPARSTVAVSGLPKGASVEVELVALLPT
ncbi:MAG TPA: RidA family protein [Trueperaceae bacterium]|nr:RidA family protein [Trueperaceae bacterium]